MAISWSTIKSLLLFFGPILLPKAISYYRTIRAAPTIQGLSIRPVPPAAARALTLIFVTALCLLIKTLPIFSPEEIFSHTQSRLQIPTDVLFTRLSALRGSSGLSESDNTLRSRMSSMDSRLLYLQHGPGAMIDCSFCSPEDPNSYLYYSLPSLLIPHLFNICILGLVTSGTFTGRDGTPWRTTANIAALAVGLLDIYLVASYTTGGNARATRLEDVDFFYWRMRIYRLLALAVLDGVAGWILYLSSTNRAFLNPPSTAERIEGASSLLDLARARIAAYGIIQNTVVRDKDLRERSEQYWVHEVQLNREIMEEREVVEGVQNALNSRIDMGNIMRDAEAYVEQMVAPYKFMGAGRRENVAEDT